MLLNLASVANADTPAILWGFLRRYMPDASPETMPYFDKLVGHAIAYYHDIVRPEKRYRHPTELERAALADLAETLRGVDTDPQATTDAEAIQAIVYEVGKRHPFPELRAWFACLYQVLLGQQEGPRFGGFIALYGVAETIALIEAALARPPDATPKFRPSRRLTYGFSRRRHPDGTPPAPPAGASRRAAAGRRRLRSAEGVPPPAAGGRLRRPRRHPAAILVLSFLLTVVSYGVLTLYDRLGTIYAGHKAAYRRVAFASFCAYALSHNLGFNALSAAAVRYRLYAHWGMTPGQIARTAAFCSLTFMFGGLMLGGAILLLEPRRYRCSAKSCRWPCCAWSASRCGASSWPM